jgi:hypothetical protein
MPIRIRANIDVKSHHNRNLIKPTRIPVNSLHRRKRLRCPKRPTRKRLMLRMPRLKEARNPRAARKQARNKKEDGREFVSRAIKEMKRSLDIGQL